METYSELFEGLNPMSKLELIGRLSKSLKTDQKKKENSFYKSFGAFLPGAEAEDIIHEIKSSRKFRKKEFKL